MHGKRSRDSKMRTRTNIYPPEYNIYIAVHFTTPRDEHVTVSTVFFFARGSFTFSHAAGDGRAVLHSSSHRFDSYHFCYSSFVCFLSSLLLDFASFCLLSFSIFFCNQEGREGGAYPNWSSGATRFPAPTPPLLKQAWGGLAASEGG